VHALEGGVSFGAVSFSEISPSSSAESAGSAESQALPGLSAELERLAARARELNASPEVLSLARAVVLALSAPRDPAA
jgi:hypothetical protein